MAIFQRVLALQKGLRVAPNYVIKGPGKSRGSAALVYLVPGRAGKRDSQKRVRDLEWEAAFQQLYKEGEFTRRWFNENLLDAAKDGGCSFRFIGEVFVLLGIAIRVAQKKGSRYVLYP